MLKADESTHIDELAELLENQMSSSEIFAALFELELNGKIRQLPGKNFVKSFWLSGISYQSKPEEPVQSFRSLGVWEKRTTPTLDVYSSSKTFPREDMYGLTSQMRRASASIGMNIAEGCCRKGNVEMARFLQIAMGSGSELEYQLLLAHDLDYLRNLEYERLATQAVEVKRMLSSVVQKLITDN
ncbi:MAG TPA: four helix bundle protein [Candidatus Acidoferrum sp.]